MDYYFGQLLHKMHLKYVVYFLIKLNFVIATKCQVYHPHIHHTIIAIKIVFRHLWWIIEVDTDDNYGKLPTLVTKLATKKYF